VTAIEHRDPIVDRERNRLRFRRRALRALRTCGAITVGSGLVFWLGGAAWWKCLISAFCWGLLTVWTWAIVTPNCCDRCWQPVRWSAGAFQGPGPLLCGDCRRIVYGGPDRRMKGD